MAPIIQKAEKYLGLPPIVGTNKKRAFSEIKERGEKKLHGWKEKFLSQAGKEVLLKVVAQSVLTFAMNCCLMQRAFVQN